MNNFPKNKSNALFFFFPPHVLNICQMDPWPTGYQAMEHKLLGLWKLAQNKSFGCCMTMLRLFGAVDESWEIKLRSNDRTIQKAQVHLLSRFSVYSLFSPKKKK